MMIIFSKAWAAAETGEAFHGCINGFRDAAEDLSAVPVGPERWRCVHQPPAVLLGRSLILRWKQLQLLCFWASNWAGSWQNRFSSRAEPPQEPWSFSGSGSFFIHVFLFSINRKKDFYERFASRQTPTERFMAEPNTDDFLKCFSRPLHPNKPLPVWMEPRTPL